MPRIKKRIQKKKHVLRKTVKRNIKDRSQNTSKTPEEKARENEMLKVMLGRQQPIVAGQSQQNDKYQQQLDTMNKLYNNQMKSLESQKAHIKELQDNQIAAKEEVKRIIDDAKHQEQVVKQSEKNLRDKEAAEKRKEVAADKKDELDRELRKFDKRTVEGKHENEIREIDARRQQLRNDIVKKEEEIEQNRLYHDLQDKIRETHKLEDELNAMVQITQSEAFQKTDEAYVNVVKRNLELKDKYELQRLIREKQQETARLNAERLGYVEYIAETRKPLPKIKGYDKSGQPIYERNKDGQFVLDPNRTSESEWQRSIIEEDNKQKALAASIDTLKTEAEHFRNRQKRAQLARLETSDKELELRKELEYIESGAYKDAQKRLAEQQQFVDIKQRELESGMKNIEHQRKLNELAARNEVAARFDPSAINPEAVQAQMDEYVHKVSEAWNGALENANREIERAKRVEEIESAFSNVLSRYDDINVRSRAQQHLFRMVDIKTGGKLGDDYTTWDSVNSGRLLEFINMMGRLNPEILSNADEAGRFVDGDEFKGFKWDIVEGTQ